MPVLGAANPPSAANPILPRMFKLNSVTAGVFHSKGAVSGFAPRAHATAGSTIIADAAEVIAAADRAKIFLIGVGEDAT